MKTLSDLQPQVVHFYEVSNFGPFDVGNVIVNISWPLQTDEGNWLLYLTDVPYFKVKFLKKTSRTSFVRAGERGHLTLVI